MTPPRTETILWATKIGAEDWQEEIITVHADRIEVAKAWATRNGYDRFRISTLDLDKRPDFTQTKEGGTP